MISNTNKIKVVIQVVDREDNSSSSIVVIMHLEVIIPTTIEVVEEVKEAEVVTNKEGVILNLLLTQINNTNNSSHTSRLNLGLDSLL